MTIHFGGIDDYQQTMIEFFHVEEMCNLQRAKVRHIDKKESKERPICIAHSTVELGL